MPIKPTPLAFDCTICGWRKTTAPNSDVIASDDFFTCCSECGNRDLVVREASPWAAWLTRLRKKWTTHV
ncbi:hypothetical protein [Pseudomonas flexibilis]|uniref:Uncharacterized protein n=1 Tax=Pseudomonas flexibilis TaxID=706570 RepID=A0A0B3BR84_9PSED|nr:hypothetical protein [Pseudomonas flexibilis]KHO63571.1 hypothetical protein PT85_16610 [Pseudomonas flexibilis]SCY56277.1 hypothetical protein SAMN02927929_03317 [Pseudomonas flexibilis]